MKEYDVQQISALLETVGGLYDLARVVDPIECRVIEIDPDGAIRMNQSCYGIWNAEQKCMNCTSALACRTGCRQEKEEHFQDRLFHIESNPIRMKLPDGAVYDAVLELVKIKKERSETANDRAAENLDHKADHYHALHDTLTKALNAGAFYELSHASIVNGKNASWVMITANVMNFRLINTLFGVIKGNEILVRTANALVTIADHSGGQCGRLGGDQFALLLPKEEYREETLLNTAQRLAEAYSSGIFTFSIHFGVYRMEDSTIPISVMCDRANAALRTIRDDLRKTVAYFDDSMMQKSILEHQIISGFDRALKDGQFKMYLQPLVGEDGSVFGAEALVRWHKPDGTVAGPGEFIETLEKAGIIHELDSYIWEEAVKLLSRWKRTEKRNLTISVNMSAKDFYSMDVYKALTELIEKYDVESRKLRIEITETALLEEPEKSDRIVAILKEKGFCVEIDDFGKGYSSLGMLKDIQADVLKIDMSLLSEIESKQRSRIILESVINMAGSLGMEVITEGVETLSQMNSLATMGCRNFQGFYFSQPVTVDEFDRVYARLENQRKE